MNEAEEVRNKVLKADAERQRSIKYYGGTAEATKMVNSQMAGTF